MPERLDVDSVRSEMQRHDRAQESPSSGPSDRTEGVTIAELDPAGDERFQLLRRELGVSAFGLNLIRLAPGQRGRIHRHERQEEVYVVLEGTLTLDVEGKETHALGQGSLVRVAPLVRRQLTNRGGEQLSVLAIGGAESHEGRDGTAFTSWDDTEGAAPRDIPLPEDVEHA